MSFVSKSMKRAMDIDELNFPADTQVNHFQSQFNHSIEDIPVPSISTYEPSKKFKGKLVVLDAEKLPEWIIKSELGTIQLQNEAEFTCPPEYSNFSLDIESDDDVSRLLHVFNYWGVSLKLTPYEFLDYVLFKDVHCIHRIVKSLFSDENCDTNSEIVYADFARRSLPAINVFIEIVDHIFRKCIEVNTEQIAVRTLELGIFRRQHRLFQFILEYKNISLTKDIAAFKACKLPIYVAKHGDLKMMKYLRQFDCPISAPSLRWAFKCDRKEIIEYLTSQNCPWKEPTEQERSDFINSDISFEVLLHLLDTTSIDIDTQLEDEDYLGNTALFNAVIRHDVRSIRILVDYGANLDLQENYDSGTPLYAASRYGDDEVVRFLLSQNAGVNVQVFLNGETALYSATCGKHREIVHLLLNHGADPNIADYDNCPPLYHACSKGLTAIVRMLLSHNADVNIKILSSGETPLICACRKANSRIVNLLLQHAANVNVVTENHNTALTVTAKSGKLGIMKMLLQYNPEINFRNDKGESALFIAALRGHFEIVKLLLSKNADPHVGNLDGVTPLSGACDKGTKQIVKLLLQSGANTTTRDCNGNTALHAASYRASAEIIQLLLDHQANVNEINDSGETALHIASSQGRKCIIKLLIERGADISITDLNGNTALNIAVQFGLTNADKLFSVHSAN